MIMIQSIISVCVCVCVGGREWELSRTLYLIFSLNFKQIMIYKYILSLVKVWTVEWIESGQNFPGYQWFFKKWLQLSLFGVISTIVGHLMPNPL